jgi:hypothetical protein
MGAPPVEAVGVGSRLRRLTGDCYDNFNIDFVYDKQVHMGSMCRQINDCANSVSEHITGTKGYMICGNRKYNMWDHEGNSLYEYASPEDETGVHLENDPYVQEHIDLVNAIRTGNQIVEAEETAKSNLTAIMGRHAAYTGTKVTWEEMMGAEWKLGPEGELAMGPVDMDKVSPIAGSAAEM